jgi:septum formation inhibitor MinC
MYFKRPEQLLEIFAQLEERNLFLIQNVQETEEALEELKQKMKDTEQTMKEKTQQLDLNIQGLNEKIKIEQDKAEQYRRRTSANTTTGNLVKLLAALSEKVREVYRKCDFDGGEQMMTLDMLREIEGRLESLLNEIKGLEEKKVREAEKKKENERRNRVRRKKKEEQKKQYEERLAKSTARAKAEVIRQTGKQLMFRSPPVRKKKKKEENEKKNDDDAEDVKKFFT